AMHPRVQRAVERVLAGRQLLDAGDRLRLPARDERAVEEARRVGVEVMLGDRVEVGEPQGVAGGRAHGRCRVVEARRVGLLLRRLGCAGHEQHESQAEQRTCEPAPRHHLIRNAPRMYGWMRQKYVYVPGGRAFGVSHSPWFEAAVKPVGPYPSSAESKSMGPFARG